TVNSPMIAANIALDGEAEALTCVADDGKGIFSASSLVPDKTGTVWDSINPTQDAYDGTQIPRSFTLSTHGADVWVAPNASEHMAEYALGNNGSAGGFSPNLVNLNSQIQLSSLQAAVGDATANGVSYGTLINQGDWELIFSPPRQSGQLPALIHALPTN
ncbi:hypothetical protein, partial [Dyella flagellata]